MTYSKLSEGSIIDDNGLIEFLINDPHYNDKKGTYKLKVCSCELDNSTSSDSNDKFTFSYNGKNYIINFSEISDYDVSSDEYKKIKKIGEATDELKKYISYLKKIVKKYYKLFDVLSALTLFLLILPFIIGGKFYSVIVGLTYIAVNKTINFINQKMILKKNKLFTKLINKDFSSFDKVSKNIIDKIIKYLKEKDNESPEFPTSDKMFTMVEQEQGTSMDTSSYEQNGRQRTVYSNVNPVKDGFNGMGSLRRNPFRKN